MDWFDFMEPQEERRLPEGFDLLPTRLELDFEAVRDALAWKQESIHFPQAGTIPLPRLTAMYGSEYTYSGVHHPAQTLPPLLLSIARQVEAATHIAFNSVLCNLYRSGRDSVSWHSDDDYHFTRPEIASVSIGGTRTFRIRSKADHTAKFSLELTHGTILLMSGRSQVDWQHMVPKTTKPVEPRINLTFRCIRP